MHDVRSEQTHFIYIVSELSLGIFTTSSVLVDWTKPANELI